MSTSPDQRVAACAGALVAVVMDDLCNALKYGGEDDEAPRLAALLLREIDKVDPLRQPDAAARSKALLIAASDAMAES